MDVAVFIRLTFKKMFERNGYEVVGLAELAENGNGGVDFKAKFIMLSAMGQESMINDDEIDRISSAV